jgi:hypothetical protein
MFPGSRTRAIAEGSHSRFQQLFVCFAQQFLSRQHWLVVHAGVSRCRCVIREREPPFSIQLGPAAPLPAAARTVTHASHRSQSSNPPTLLSMWVNSNTANQVRWMPSVRRSFPGGAVRATNSPRVRADASPKSIPAQCTAAHPQNQGQLILWFRISKFVMARFSERSL